MKDRWVTLSLSAHHWMILRAALGRWSMLLPAKWSRTALPPLPSMQEFGPSRIERRSRHSLGIVPGRTSPPTTKCRRRRFGPARGLLLGLVSCPECRTERRLSSGGTSVLGHIGFDLVDPGPDATPQVVDARETRGAQDEAGFRAATAHETMHDRVSLHVQLSYALW